MATCFLQELELEGAFLPQDERDKVRELKAHITQLELQYQHNCSLPFPSTVEIPVDLLEKVVNKSNINQYPKGNTTNTRTIEIQNMSIGALLRNQSANLRMV